MSLSDLLPWYAKLGIGAAIVGVIYATGYTAGQDDILGRWKKTTDAVSAAVEENRDFKQNAADSAGQITANREDNQHKVIINQPQELADASNKDGPCSSQSLSDDSMRLYARTAAAR